MGKHHQLQLSSVASIPGVVHYLVICIFVFTVIIATINWHRDDKKLPAPASSAAAAAAALGEECNLFEGKWVFDNDSLPLYKGKGCPYMSDQLACEKYGRTDLSYQKWRWQPRHCDLPRFNAMAVLEKLRNKRLVYVGDSLNRGQWVSMVCLVEQVIEPHLKTMTINGSLSSFNAIEYNASIDYYWAPMLVESNSDDPVNHSSPERIVRAESIERHATHWTNSDILVFDSYLWWLGDKMKVLWGSFGSPDAIVKDVDMPLPYEMALKTWAEWLELHIDRAKTQTYFVSLSPTHYRAEDWGGTKGQNCYSEIEPIENASYWGSNSIVSLMRIVERVMSDLQAKGLKISLLNITQLSEYRKDGHPSIYRRQWEPLTKEQLGNPIGYADCAHWCLPGVPDTWNQILHSYII